MSKVFVEGRHVGEFILNEANGHRSRENILILAAQTIAVGAILALVTDAGGVTVNALANGAITGNGTITASETPVSGAAKAGVYIVTATSATKFAVVDPQGKSLGDATLGTAFDKEIKFTIAAGTQAFVTGDQFHFVVHTNDHYTAVAYNPAGTGGSEKAAAIAIYPAATGAGEITKIACLIRDAEVNGKCLSWPEGTTAAQQAEATVALAAAGIIVR